MCALSAKLYGCAVIFNLDINFLWIWKQFWIWIVKGKIRLNTCMSKGQQNCFEWRCKCWPCSLRNYMSPKGTAGARTQQRSGYRNVDELKVFQTEKYNQINKWKELNSSHIIYEMNKTTSSIHFSLLIFQCLIESFVLRGTCCKEWRKLPSLHLSHWCGWHLSQPAGCWSRSGNHQGWNSSVETWGRRSTVSPRRVVSHLGHSCKPSPREETPPDQDIAASLHLNNSTHTHHLNITGTWSHLQSLALITV